MTTTKKTKTNIILDLKKRFPNCGPTDIARLAKEEDGTVVTPGMVSTVLSTAKRSPRIGSGKRGRPPIKHVAVPEQKELRPLTAGKKSNEDTLSLLCSLSSLVEQCGGITKTRAILQALESIKR